jgi:hypothetical protein
MTVKDGKQLTKTIYDTHLQRARDNTPLKNHMEKEKLYYPPKRPKEIMLCPCCNGSGKVRDKNTAKIRDCVGCFGNGVLRIKKQVI